MYKHAPDDYICPLCLTAKGIENENTMAKTGDIFYQDELVYAMINSKFFSHNPGHVIVVPNDHYENIYDIPKTIAHRVFDVAQQVAIAMKEVRNCEGVTTIQNNEPASAQHAFHFHFHIIPRFERDMFYEDISHAYISGPEKRLSYANDLRKYFEKHFYESNHIRSHK